MEARKGLVLASLARKFLALLSEDMLQPARLSPGGKKGGAWGGLGGGTQCHSAVMCRTQLYFLVYFSLYFNLNLYLYFLLGVAWGGVTLL